MRSSAIGETHTVELLTDDGLLVLLHRRPLPGVTVRPYARPPRRCSMSDPIPRPPWPPRHRCHAPHCGHIKAEHAAPLVEDGHCTVAACPCTGWDPLSAGHWARLARERIDRLNG